ncbi:MAG: T9SS type A sorting domain-containing protein, partial [Bacteroidetes bacterium]|nr:T9SS type A sorting domain-containing protein [Bacteroidota bacterium]
QLDNRVRLTNLPQKCKVSIYTVDGSLVRRYNIDYTNNEDLSYLDWDLKNAAGVPIASGVYIIHIDSDFGTKVLKWFGVMRPIDLDTF